MDKLIAKLRKMLAMAKSANEHEAMAFMDAVHAMLAAHNLTEAQVLNHRPAMQVGDAPMERYGYGWNQRINLAVARLYFCTYFQVDLPDGTRRYQFCGERHNLDVAQLMAGYIVNTGKRLAKSSSAYLRDAIEKKRYNESFREAFSVRVAQRIKERIESTKTHTTVPGGTNLPAVIEMHNAAAQAQQQWLVEQLGGAAHAKVPSTKVEHVEGLAAGYKAGDDVGLDTQIGNTTTGRLQ